MCVSPEKGEEGYIKPEMTSSLRDEIEAEEWKGIYAF